jgi:hypothetical protein
MPVGSRRASKLRRPFKCTNIEFIWVLRPGFGTLSALRPSTLFYVRPGFIGQNAYLFCVSEGLASFFAPRSIMPSWLG